MPETHLVVAVAFEHTGAHEDLDVGTHVGGTCHPLEERQRRSSSDHRSDLRGALRMPAAVQTGDEHIVETAGDLGDRFLVGLTT